MPSIRQSMNKWLGIEDVSHLGSGCIACETAPISIMAQAEPKAVNLKDLQFGDRFIVEGFDREREYLRRQGNTIISRDVQNLSIEEMPTSTKVFKTGHRVGPAPICDIIPKDTKDNMVKISEDSYNRFVTVENDKMGIPAYQIRTIREMGAVITNDYTLGEVKVGTKDRVDIPRKGDILGTFHTHPGGNVSPGDFDLVDMLGHNDKLQCICATGLPGTKCQCYVPHEPQWTNLRIELTKLLDDIRAFNKATHSKWGLKGKNLRKFLQAVGSSAYLRTGLPYSVTQIPGLNTAESRRAEGGGLKKATTRQIIGTEPISIEQKQATFNRWYQAHKNAIAAYQQYEDVLKRVKALVEQSRDKIETSEHIRADALADGDYITIYRLDQINNPVHLQQIRDSLANYPRAFTFASIPYQILQYGNAEEHERVSRELTSALSEIGELQNEIKTLLSPQKVLDIRTLDDTQFRADEDRINGINDQMQELYFKASNLFDRKWLTKPVIKVPTRNMSLIVVNESRRSFESNPAASELIAITKQEAVETLDLRGDEIQTREIRQRGHITDLAAQIKELVGSQHKYPVTVAGGKTEIRTSGWSGGRAQPFREIIRDTTKTERERREAGLELDDLERQATVLRHLLTVARSELKESRFPGKEAEVELIRYAPDIEGLMLEINGLSQQIHDLQPELDAKLSTAVALQNAANEIRAEVDVLSKNRTTEYNEAVATVQRGDNLEVRRQNFITRLRLYGTQTGLLPDTLALANDRLLTSCRLIWEQETADVEEESLDVQRALENIIKARTVRVKATGETGVVEGYKADIGRVEEAVKAGKILPQPGFERGIYTVKVGDKTLELTTSEIDFLE